MNYLQLQRNSNFQKNIRVRKEFVNLSTRKLIKSALNVEAIDSLYCRNQ